MISSSKTLTAAIISFSLFGNILAEVQLSQHVAGERKIIYLLHFNFNQVF